MRIYKLYRLKTNISDTYRELFEFVERELHGLIKIIDSDWVSNWVDYVKEKRIQTEKVFSYNAFSKNVYIEYFEYLESLRDEDKETLNSLKKFIKQIFSEWYNIEINNVYLYINNTEEGDDEK